MKYDAVRKKIADLGAGTLRAREFNDFVVMALCPIVEFRGPDCAARYCTPDTNGNWKLVPDFDASLDACVALVRRRFPAGRWVLDARTDAPCTARLIDLDHPVEYAGSGATPQLALLDAFFVALGEMEKEVEE